jgi:hypothetical protein
MSATVAPQTRHQPPTPSAHTTLTYVNMPTVIHSGSAFLEAVIADQRTDKYYLPIHRFFSA